MGKPEIHSAAEFESLLCLRNDIKKPPNAVVALGGFGTL